MHSLLGKLGVRFLKIYRHQFCDSVTFSLRSAFMSRIPFLFWSEEWPSSWWKSFRMNRNEIGAQFAFLFIVFRSPWDVVKHRHEDDPFCKFFWLFAHWQELLDFVAELQCGESWGNIPLEFHLGSPSIVSKVLYCDESLNHPNCRCQTQIDCGSCSFFQGIPQNLKILKSTCARDWWLLHHQSKINVSMKNHPSWLYSLHRCHLIVRLSTFQMCQTSVTFWDPFLYFWWNAKFLVILSHEYTCL